MLVTLPFILLLLDYWPLVRWQTIWKPVQVRVCNTDPGARKNGKRRIAGATAEQKTSQCVNDHNHLIGAILWEKVPFFVLTALSIRLTLWAQWIGIAPLDGLPIVYRTLNAVLSYLSYVVLFFYPVNLAVLYPYSDSIPLWQVSIAALLLLGISIAVIYNSKKAPFLFVGWFWYLGTLIPVIGLVQVGRQAMADRYTYLPSIGIAIMLAWGIPLLFRSKDIRKRALWAAGSAVIATLVFLSWMQCGYWKNSINLFSHALHVTKNNFWAHQSIALVLTKDGKINEAIYHYSEAIRLNPTFANADNNGGTIYGKLTQHQLVAEAYNNRGTLYGTLNQYKIAMEDFNKAIQLNPNHAEAHNNKGYTYYMTGQDQRAILDYNKAIHLKPDYVDAYCNRAVIYFRQGNKELGCLDAHKACKLGNCKTLDSAKDKGYCR